MAQTSISLGQEQFNCSICLDLLKEPVAIPCGHTYCMGCIKGCWDKSDSTCVYSCPQCRQTFTPRPSLNKNTVLAEVMEKLEKAGLLSASPTPCSAEPGGVICDFCSGEASKAVKSCLMCLASYCESHLQQHYQVPALKKHTLVEAIGQLQEKICHRHNKLLEAYCCTDKTCICYQCLMDEHRGHNAVSADAEWTKLQKQLGDTQRQYQQRIQEKEKGLGELKQAKKTLMDSARAALVDAERVFTELVRSIERRHLEVKELIRDQGKAAVCQADDLLERLEQEIAELKRRDAELEQLLHTKDHINFLQSYQSVCVAPGISETLSISVIPVLDFGMVQRAISDLRKTLEHVCEEEWLKILRPASSPLTEGHVLQDHGPKTREEFLQYFSKITLDFNTAHQYLNICNQDPNWILVMMKFGRMFGDSPYPDHPERFQNVQQILCREALCGRCYWEVDWYGTHEGYIAVSYKGIDRKGGEDSDSHFTQSDKSWCLKCTLKGYSVWHNSVETAVRRPDKNFRKIGVYLDHGAGILSFYCVSDTMVLLHKFQTVFTEPLHPGLGGWGFGDQVRISKP